MALTLQKSRRTTTEGGSYLQVTIPATATKDGYASEIPARGATISSVTGDTWTDTDYIEPQLVFIRRQSPTNSHKIKLSLVFRGAAFYKSS